MSQTQPLDLATKLALERTRVAYERTVMASIRTATSLITFGFTIYKFFEFDLRGRSNAEHWLGPRELGMAMIGMGLISLLLGWLEYRRDIREIRRIYPDAPRSTAGVSAAMLGVLGVFLLIVAALRG